MEEIVNPLKVGDIIYPEILFKGKAIKIRSICLFTYLDDRIYTTAWKTCLLHDHEHFKPWKPESWIGWPSIRDDYRYRPRGVKIFVANAKAGPLQENQAIRVVKVFKRSALGELIEIRVKQGERE